MSSTRPSSMMLDTSDAESRDRQDKLSLDDSRHFGMSVVAPKTSQTSPSSSVSLHDYDLQQSNLTLLKAELKLVTHDRDILKKELSRYRQMTGALPGSPLGSHPSSPAGSMSGTLPRSGLGGSMSGMGERTQSSSSFRDYDALRQQCDMAMQELQLLKRQHIDTVRRCDAALKEADYYRNQHRSVLSKLDASNQESLSLRSQFGEVIASKRRLEQEILIISQAREEDRKELTELRLNQQDLLKAESGSHDESFQDAALRKFEAIKEDHEALRKRYSDLIASHSAAVSKLELAQEEVSRLKKQCETLDYERNTAIRESKGLRQQCTSAIYQWNDAVQERDKLKELLTKSQKEYQKALKDIDEAMAVRMKATKEIKKLTEERNAAVQEYSLIMSERDSVHKEIEKLQDELNQATKKTKTFEGKMKELNEENKALHYQSESLRREVSSALLDRDEAIKEVNELRKRLGEQNDNNPYTDGFKLRSDKDSEKKDRDSRGERQDPSIGGFRGERDNKSQRGEQADNLDQANQEIEKLRKLTEKLQAELNEAVQENEISKRRRDWAFSERDKIVSERETLRTYCDQLRRERDLEALKAAEALRGNDDLEKQRTEAVKIVQELREKLDARAERESRVNQLRGGVGPGPPQPHNQSCDSAIDSDGAGDWEDTLEVMMVGGGEELGFDISGGKSTPLYSNDTGIYIGTVAKGSQVDGKLRANDCILKVGNLDCQNVDRRTVLETLYNTDGQITLLIRRRKSHSKGLYSVQVAIGAGQEHGISLDSGVFVSRVAPSSPFAREADICPGDRILSINGRDYLRNSQEVLRILEDISNSGGLISLTVIRGVIMAQSVQSPRLSSPASTNTSAPMSASSSFHNMAEDGGSSKCEKCSHGSKSQPNLPVKDKKSSGGFNKLFSLSPRSEDRRHSSNEKVYRVNKENNRSSASSSSGLGPFEIIRDRITRSRRHSKERISGREGSQDGIRNQNISPDSFSHDKEDAAVAVFDFLDEYQMKDNNKARRNESAQERKKREKQQAMSSGGTWPRCRGEVIHDPHTEQVFTAPKHRDRLPLSVFSGFAESEEQHRTSLIDYENWQCGQFRQSALHTFRPIESSSSLAGHYATLPGGTSRKAGNEYENIENMTRLRTPLTPSDTSIDFSVKSGNVGNTLDYYVKKKGGSKFSQSDCESESNISTSELNSPPHVTTSSSCTHSLGSNTSLTAQLQNLRIHTQLYGSPTALPGMRTQPSFQPYTPPYYSTTHSHTHTHNSPSISLPPVLSARYVSPPLGKPMISSLSSPTSLLRRDLTSRGQFDACSDGFGSVNPSPVSQLYSHSPTPSVEMGYGYGSIPRSVVPMHSHNHPWSRSSTIDSQISQHGFGDGVPLFGVPAEPKRIRMPSNQSMTSRGSVDRCSESPAPNLIVEYIGANGSRTTEIRSMLKDLTWARKPSPGDLRRIQIEKSINPSEPLGIEIICPNNGGVFVSSVRDQSLAARVGLQVGDQLLEVCGINMRSATHSLAASVLRQCGDSITMLVQYSPEKYDEVSQASLEENHTRTQSHSDSPTPCNSPKPPRNPNHDAEDLPHSGSSTLRSPLNPEEALRSVLNYNLMMETGNNNSLRNSVNYDRPEPSFIRPKQASLDEGSRTSYRHSSIDDKSSSGASTVRNSLRQSSLDEKSQNGNTAARNSRRQASMDEKAMLRSSLNFDRERPASTYATMTRHQMSLPRQSTLLDGDLGRLEQCSQPGSRILFLELKKSSNLGVGLVGGNAVGIFIHQVHPDSPAQVAGLRCGDQILEYNGSDLRFSTAEQAAYELAKPAEKAAIIVQYDYERYKEILDQPGDSFYVKALFDRPGDGSFGSLGSITGSEGGELRFKKDDILYVDNTMLNGVPGLWRAWLLDSSGRKLQCGIIPSKYKVEEELLIRKSLGDLESGRGSIASARRSFFRRRNKLHRSSSRDSKELASFSDMGGGNYSESNTLSIHEDSSPIQSYVRVERLEYQRPRPIVLVGPLSEYVLDKLVNDQPSEYVRCLPEIVRASQSFVEKACSDLIYLDCRRRGSHFECTSVASIRDIAESNRHCVLDIPLHSIEKLHQCRIFPIVVFVKFKSVKQIREVKDGRLPAEKLSGKAAKEMHDYACKIESDYRHLISAIVPAGSSFAYMRTQVVAAVRDEQRKTIWVPSGSLW